MSVGKGRKEMQIKYRKYINYIIAAFTLILFVINMYYEYSVYFDYRKNLSGGSVRKEKYMASQVTYFSPVDGITDPLLVTIIKDKDIVVYGDYEVFRPFFNSFAGSAEYAEETVDYELLRANNWKLDLGSLSLGRYSMLTEMTDDEEFHLIEMRILNNARLFLSGYGVAEKEKLICVADELTNIYLMTEEEIGRFIHG